MAGGALGRSDDPMGVERVVFFSDAVFAIAITLLVIELTVPEGDLTGAQLTHELGRLGPKFFSFGLSFWVIGRFWIGHHLTFQYLRRWNLPMLWLNLLLLACIAFLPFPTAVLGNHLGLPVAVRLYAASVTVTGLASTLLWWYATGRGRLVDEDLDPRVRRFMLLRALTAPVVFGLSIPLVTVQVPVGAGRISLASCCGCCWSRRSGWSSAWWSWGDAGPVAAGPPATRGLPGIPRGADGHDRDVGSAVGADRRAACCLDRPPWRHGGGGSCGSGSGRLVQRAMRRANRGSQTRSC